MQDTDTDTAPLGRLQISCDVASTIMDGDQQQRQQEQHRARSTTSSTCVSLVSATGSCVTQVRAHADDDDADDTSECASDAKPGMLVTKDALDSEEASPSTTSCLLLNVGLPPEIMAIVMELVGRACVRVRALCATFSNFHYLTCPPISFIEALHCRPAHRDHRLPLLACMRGARALARARCVSRRRGRRSGRDPRGPWPWICYRHVHGSKRACASSSCE